MMVHAKNYETDASMLKLCSELASFSGDGV